MNKPITHEHPIIFSAPMVRAVIARTKGQTRRLLKPPPPSVEAVRAKCGTGFSIFTDHHWPEGFRVGGPVWAVRELMGREPRWKCPYGVPGDRLWVRETWAIRDCGGRVSLAPGAWPDGWPVDRLDYMATDTAPARTARGAPYWWNKRPAIHMPRWASRLTLDVSDVRVQRLQDITEEDARAEGVAPLTGIAAEQRIPCDRLGRTHGGHPYTLAFAVLWDEINGDRAPWKEDPWVWAVSFGQAT